MNIQATIKLIVTVTTASAVTCTLMFATITAAVTILVITQTCLQIEVQKGEKQNKTKQTTKLFTHHFWGTD